MLVRKDILYIERNHKLVSRKRSADGVASSIVGDERKTPSYFTVDR